MSNLLDMLLCNLVIGSVIAALAIACRRAAPAVAHLLWLLVLLKLLTPPLVFLNVNAVWRPSLPSVLAITWACGVAAWLVIVVMTVRRFTRFLRYATPASPTMVAELEQAAARIGVAVPQLRVLPGCIAPFVWSSRTPTIYFPADLADRLSPEQRRLILAHELAHLRRGDHVVRWLEVIALAAYWWCPLAWVARWKVHTLQEDCSDAEVLRAFPDDRERYASAILDTLDFLAKSRPTTILATTIGDVQSLRQRLTTILHRTPHRSVGRWEQTLVVLLVIGVLLIGVRQTDAIPQDVPVLVSESVSATSAVELRELGEHAVHVHPTPTRLFAIPVADVSAIARSPQGLLARAIGQTIEIWDTNHDTLLITVWGHTETVSALVFSADGQTLVSAGKDGVVNVWSAKRWHDPHRIVAHANWIAAVAISPDGRTIATAGYDRTVQLIDAISGQIQRTLREHTAVVRAVAFSADGESVLSGGADGRAILWQTQSGTPTLRLPVQTSTVRAVAITPDGSRLVTGCDDGSVRCWQLRDGKPIGSPIVGGAAVTTMSVRLFDSHVAVGFEDGRLLIVDAHFGRLRSWFAPPASAPHAADVDGVHPVNSGWLSGSRDGTILLWRPLSPPLAAARRYRGHSQMVKCLAVSPNSETIATGGHDGTIRVFDALTGDELAVLTGHTGGVTFVSFAGRQRLISCGADETVRIWNLQSKRQLRSHSVSSPDVVLAVSPDGERYAVGGPRMNGVTVWEVTTGRGGRQIGGKVGTVSAVAFTPRGDRLLLGTPTGEATAWDASNGRERERRIVHSSAAVTGFAVSANDTLAAVVLNLNGCDEQTDVHRVVMWDYQHGRLGSHPLELDGTIHSAAFAADGTLITAGHDGNLLGWDVQTGRCVHTIRAHAASALAVTLTPTAIVSAGDDCAKWWPLSVTVAAND